MEQRKFICLWLSLITLAVFWPLTHFEFTNYDDLTYVTANPIVRAGVTKAGVIWAFETVLTKKGVIADYETVYASDYWHPVTWISHMVDCQIYGLKAGGHHLTNIILHIANTLLLFLILHHYTGALGRSALVAALFAWHPLHVEPVAWIAARKDVLSTFFWLLTMLAYGNYAKENKTVAATGTYAPRRYVFFGLALVFFTLGLLSKPMVVTLPLVLLLMDYWPLQRFPNLSWRKLVWEKGPFFVLSAVISVIALWGRKHVGVVIDSQILPLSVRLMTIPANYVIYLWKTLCPVNLAVLYPYTERSFTVAILSLLFLSFITIMVIGQWRKRPYLVAGWLWFLGTLVPVIGLTQVGIQSIADRYTYIPLIGIFIMGVWGIPDLGKLLPKVHFPIETVAVILFGCLLAGTWHQVQYWQNSVTLFRHTAAITKNNIRAEYNLADGLREQGNRTEAIVHLKHVLTMQPNILEAHFNCQPKAHFGLGTFYGQDGDYPAAEAELRIALKELPNQANVHQNLGNVLLAEGRLAEAVSEFQIAARLQPLNPALWQSAGFALAAAGKFREATTNYSEALRLQPNDPVTHDLLAQALAFDGDFRAAASSYNEALRVQPQYVLAHLHLGNLLADHGQQAEALAHYAEALSLDPQLSEKLADTGRAQVEGGRFQDAITNFRSALRLNPDAIQTLDQLAWLLATCANDAIRNGPEAVRLAQHACDLTAHADQHSLAALDAAYAEAGRFSDAIATAQKARDLAVSSGQQNEAIGAEERLKFYRSGKPYRETPRQKTIPSGS